MNEEELLPLLKQLAEGVLKQKQIIEDLRGRVARLEHVLTSPALENHSGMVFTGGGVPVYQGTTAAERG